MEESHVDAAPLVWLASTDTYYPSDIARHLLHVQPKVDFKPVTGAPNPLSLDNLNQLNNLGGTNVFLTSNDDVTTNPAWLKGVKPDASGKTAGANTAAVVVNTHADGVVDAFYFYFYSYNLGNKVFGQNLGNHVGDWYVRNTAIYCGLASNPW